MAHEPPGWAFLCGLGAGFIASALVQLAVIAVYPVLFPPTREFTFFIHGRTLWEGAGGIAAGAVATRAGGPRALVLYAAFELTRLAAELPGGVYSCAVNPGLTEGRACDFASLVAHDWPTWLAIAIGSVAARALAAHGDGANRVLRAAGALAAAMTVAFSLGALALFLIVLPNRPSGLVLGFMGLGDIATYSLALGTLVGGTLAGWLLARRSLAAPLLLAVCLVAPSFASGVPLLRTNSYPPSLPLWALLPVFSWLWIPSLGALALFTSWAVARRRGEIGS